MRSMPLSVSPRVFGISIRRLTGAQLLAHPRVVKDGTVWTRQGPGTAQEFALAIVEELRGPATAQRLAEAMLVT